VSLAERQYSSGAEPQVLDIVAVPLLTPQPTDVHQENWLLDPRATWKKVGRFGWNELRAMEQNPKLLWVNGHSTSKGENDLIPVKWEPAVMDSLQLIRVDSVKIKVCPNYPNANAKFAVRASFQHAGWQYIMKVTDPIYKARYCARGSGEYTLRESFLTVSLTEEFQGNFFKLIAAIVERVNVEPGRPR
jgi:hypothetical protein